MTSAEEQHETRMKRVLSAKHMLLGAKAEGRAIQAIAKALDRLDRECFTNEAMIEAVQRIVGWIEQRYGLSREACYRGKREGDV